MCRTSWSGQGTKKKGTGKDFYQTGNLMYILRQKLGFCQFVIVVFGLWSYEIACITVVKEFTRIGAIRNATVKSE